MPVPVPVPVLVVSRPSQLKAFAHPTRVKILDMLIEKPLTVKQMGDLLGMSAARAHYHLKFLEGAGLVCLVERREKAGVVEKYYRAASRKYIVGSSLGTFGQPGAVILEALAAAMLRGAVCAVQGVPMGLVAGANERVAVRLEDLAGLLGVANALQAAQDELRALAADGGGRAGPADGRGEPSPAPPAQTFELTYALYAVTASGDGGSTVVQAETGPQSGCDHGHEPEDEPNPCPTAPESEPDATC
jgi:DNA-binding transcriptional ArsR family regulator